MSESQNKEAVNHPAHYGGGENPYEVIKVIEAFGWAEGFCLGNALKYMARYKKKGAPDEDLKKGKWYLDRFVKYIEDAKRTQQ